MKDFLDLNGASGVKYRFRLWPEGTAHRPIGGNYVFLKEEPEGFKVLLVGAANDLSSARADWSKVASRGETRVFTRLNVSRTARQAVHEDLVAGFKPALASEGVS